MGRKNPSFVFFKWLIFIFSPLILSIHHWISKLHMLTQSQMSLVVKNSPTNAGEIRVADLIPGLGSSTGEGNSNPLQYSCLENFMNRGASLATVYGVAKSRTWLSERTHTHTHTHTNTPRVSALSTDSESKRVLMQVEGASCDANTDFCCLNICFRSSEGDSLFSFCLLPHFLV